MIHDIFGSAPVPELLAHVLRYATYGYDKENPSTAFRVLKVCQKWRSVALSTPRIWSCLRISSKHKSPHQVAQFFLQNAGPILPLDIFIDFEEPLNDQATAMDLLADVLAPYIHRWRIFYTVLSADAAVDPLFRKCSGSAPLLEEFTIDETSEDVCSDHPDTLGPMFTHAPRLRRVVLTRATYFAWPWVGNCFFSTLTHLDIFEYSESPMMTLDNALAILEQASRLEYLLLCFHHDGDRLTSLSHPIMRFPALRSLSFTSEYDVDFSVLVHLMDTPVLRHLDLDVGLEAESELWNTLAALIKRSNPPLRELSIGGVFEESDEIVWDCLAQLPMLERLALNGAPIDDDDLEGFCPDENGIPDLCPQLAELTIYHCHKITTEGVRKLKEARALPAGPHAIQWSPLLVTVFNCVGVENAQ